MGPQSVLVNNLCVFGIIPILGRSNYKTRTLISLKFLNMDSEVKMQLLFTHVLTLPFQRVPDHLHFFNFCVLLCPFSQFLTVSIIWIWVDCNDTDQWVQSDAYFGWADECHYGNISKILMIMSFKAGQSWVTKQTGIPLSRLWLVCLTREGCQEFSWFSMRHK